MATRNTPEHEKSNFDFLITQIRQEIITRFNELFESLERRKLELLQELERISDEYKHQEMEQESMSKELHKYLDDKPSSSIIIDLQKDIVSKINTSIHTIQTQLDSFKVTFVWDIDMQQVKSIGRLQRGLHASSDSSHSTSLVKRASRQKLMPQVCIGSFYGVSGLTIDKKTSNVYIVETTWNNIHVFSKEGDFLFKFGNYAMFFGKFSCPKDIAIYSERLFITQCNSHCISIHDLEGTYINSFGTNGIENGQFTNPDSLCIDQNNGEMYICDKGNNRIQLYSSDLTFRKVLWNDILKTPLDIKLTEQSIFVLDEGSPCLHEFSYRHCPVRSTITKGILCQVVNPRGFCIDSNGYVYVTDKTMGCIYVFSDSKLLYQFGKFEKAHGVCMNEDGGVVVSSSTTGGSLQVYY